MKRTDKWKEKKGIHNAKPSAGHNRKKAPYIGAAIVGIVGLMSLAFVGGISKGSVLLRQNEPVILPTPAPVTPQTQKQRAEQAAPSTPIPIVTPSPAAAESAAPAVVATDRKPAAPQLILPTNGEILVPFSGERLIKSKTLGDWRTHDGIDIEAATGSEVKAAEGGVVERAFCDKLMGYTIVLAHEGEYKTLYQNLASTEMVTEGETVEQGQCIAAVGDSAAAEMLEKSHLHFALADGETALDPLLYMKK